MCFSTLKNAKTDGFISRFRWFCEGLPAVQFIFMVLKGQEISQKINGLSMFHFYSTKGRPHARSIN